MLRFLLTSFALLLCVSVQSQTVLFSEDFQAGNNTFTLNTTDVSSTSSGYNHWVMNNAYTGGNGQIICIGFPFTFTVPNTPSQPGAITGSPNSNYLHIVSDAAIASGINNCCFLAADGICNNPENYFAKMNSDISTVGYDTVEISFYWVCDGGNNSFGELYYSTDGGALWTKQPDLPKYNSNGSWTQIVVQDNAFANQATLRFGFRFVNQTATAASDPAFGVDEIEVTGSQSVVLPVAAFTSNIQVFCEESCVNFTDLSTNNPTGWQWFFPGGTPDTSTLQTPPQICYDDPGSYDVTLVVSNGSGTDSITIAGYIQVNATPPAPVITVNGDTLCTTPFATTYQWYFNGSVLIPGATSYCYIAIFPGAYTVVITDSTGCVATSLPVIISGIDELNTVQVFEVSPTLASDHIIIKSLYSHEIEACLFNTEGRKVYDATLITNNNQCRLNVEKFAKGVYFLHLSNGRQTEIKKVILF